MEESKDVNMVARAKHNSGKFKAMMVAVCSSLTDRNPASATPIRPPARVHLGNGICGGKYAVGMCGGIPGRRVNAQRSPSTSCTCDASTLQRYPYNLCHKLS